MTTTTSLVMFLNLNDVCFHVALGALLLTIFLFNVLAGPLVTEKDLNVGHPEASETVGMFRIIHYDWHSNYVLYIYIYIYIYFSNFI